jgi:hypothetical protein
MSDESFLCATNPSQRGSQGVLALLLRTEMSANQKSPRVAHMEKPKAFKGFLMKRGPTAMTSWNRRWFVLDDNKVCAA